MSVQDYQHLIEAAAAANALPVDLVLAMVQVESAGDPWAWNPEPHYRWFWDVKRNTPFRKVSDAEVASERPPADFPTIAGDPDQEWWAQQASWGLMQPMGAVARERGFRGAYLTELLDPATGLEYGCKHLAAYRRRFGIAGAVAAYNTGSPTIAPGSAAEVYVAKVRAAGARI